MAWSIGDEINQATKSQHTTLNRSILKFLPLALPPNTLCYRLYALGVSHFYPIYSSFESVYRDHLSSDIAPSRIARVLSRLHVQGLGRAEALERDIRSLLPTLHHYPNAGTAPCLEAFKKHMELSLSQKPHLLFAYTWIFYMAFFSGGRYIRSKLRAELQSSIAPILPQQLEPSAWLTFWEFPGELDGEDLKLEYKSRVAALTTELTEEERAEIVAESISIMTHLIDIVNEIAEVVPSQAVALALQTPAEKRTLLQAPVAASGLPWNLFIRNVFPLAFRNILSAALELVAARAPEQGVAKPSPVQVDAG